MPSSTFLNLDKEKQTKLLDAALIEFSKIPYPEVSINKIISIAQIPRGSFYMYFKDKDDLFEYIIKMNEKKINQLVKDTLRLNQGDLRNSFMELFDKIIEIIQKKNIRNLYKNVFFYFNLKKEKFRNPSNVLFQYVQEEINFQSLKLDDVEFVFDYFMHNMIFSIAEYLKNDDLSSSKNQYLKKLDILCYGIYKEEK